MELTLAAGLAIGVSVIGASAAIATAAIRIWGNQRDLVAERRCDQITSDLRETSIRVRELEKTDAVRTEQLKVLTKSIEQLAKVMKE